VTASRGRGWEDEPVSDDSRPPRLDLDVDLVPEQTSDDTDAGWGGSEVTADEDPAVVLRRYLDETPPHHGD
jgi:hypothetical protein